jgi:hypothetical protein
MNGSAELIVINFSEQFPFGKGFSTRFMPFECSLAYALEPAPL